MDTSEIKRVVNQLNKEWFDTKAKFYVMETMLLKTEAGIPQNISLSDYCWNSNIKDYSTEISSEYFTSLKLDGREVAFAILQFIEKQIEGFTDSKAIYIKINKATDIYTNEINKLISTLESDKHKEILNDFLSKTISLIETTFKIVYDQLELINSQFKTNRKLTIDLCSKIAAFTLDDKKLLTYFEGAENEEVALFKLLTMDQLGPQYRNVIVMFEKWRIFDVYYLFIELNKKILDLPSFAEIARKEILCLNRGKHFSNKALGTFKSAKLKKYLTSNPNRKAIDELIESLF